MGGGGGRERERERESICCENSPVKRLVNSLGRVALFHSEWLIVCFV